MAFYRKNAPPGNFHNIGSGEITDRHKGVDIPLELQAGVQYGFRLTGNASGLREALYQGDIGSDTPAKGGSYAIVQYDTRYPVVFTYTPSHTGNFYLEITNTSHLSGFRVGEADHYDTASKTLAAAISDTANMGQSSVPIGDQASGLSAVSSIVAPSARKADG